jgi:hypothetical protein
MPASVDATFLYGYKIPPDAFSQCPQSSGEYGHVCGNASTLLDGEKFTSAYEYMKRIDSCHHDLDQEITLRSMLWYGQSPDTYLSWIRKMKNSRTVKEATLIRFASERQVYYYQNGQLHPFNDKNTFEKLGFDFDNVVTVPDYQKKDFMIGSPMVA